VLPLLLLLLVVVPLSLLIMKIVFFDRFTSRKAVVEDGASDHKRKLAKSIRKQAKTIRLKLKKFIRQSDAEQVKMIKALEEYKKDKAKDLLGFQESVRSGNERIKDLKAQILDLSDLVHTEEALLAMAKANASVTEKALDEVEPKLDAFEATRKLQIKQEHPPVPPHGIARDPEGHETGDQGRY
jgi:hypothetical protein